MSVFFQWRDDYLVGHPVIDYDHRNLVNLINALARDADDGPNSFQVRRAIDVLTRYVDERFAREEALFRASDYPDADAHIRQHVAIAGKVHAFAGEFSGDPNGFDMDAFLEFLRDWLSRHIVGTDMAYVPYLSDHDG